MYFIMLQIYSLASSFIFMKFSQILLELLTLFVRILISANLFVDL
jgi:hypothetical protein